MWLEWFFLMNVTDFPSLRLPLKTRRMEPQAVRISLSNTVLSQKHWVANMPRASTSCASHSLSCSAEICPVISLAMACVGTTKFVQRQKCEDQATKINVKVECWKEAILSKAACSVVSGWWKFNMATKHDMTIHHENAMSNGYHVAPRNRNAPRPTVPRPAWYVSQGCRSRLDA